MQEIIEENEMIDAEMLLNAVMMALELKELEQARRYINMYLNNEKKFTYFTKPKEFYDKQFEQFNLALIPAS